MNGRTGRPASPVPLAGGAAGPARGPSQGEPTMTTQSRPGRDRGSRVNAARDHASRFIDAAKRWRAEPPDPEADRLEDECGRLVIEAAQRDFLPEIPRLREMIPFFIGDQAPVLPPGVHAALACAPANLFLHLAGVRLFFVRNDRGRMIPETDHVEGSIRLVHLLPVSPDVSDSERKARACDLLASMIIIHAGSRPRGRPESDPALNAEIRRLATEGLRPSDIGSRLNIDAAKVRELLQRDRRRDDPGAQEIATNNLRGCAGDEAARERLNSDVATK
jgi:hypothetical protein